MDDKKGRSPAKDTSILLVGETYSVHRVEEALLGARLDIIQVNSVREAREAMTAVVFPIALVDETLGEAALALIGELRRQYERHRVHLILVVADAQPVHVERALLAGADECLNTQLSCDTILGRIQDAAARVELNVR